MRGHCPLTLVCLRKYMRLRKSPQVNSWPRPCHNDQSRRLTICDLNFAGYYPTMCTVHFCFPSLSLLLSPILKIGFGCVAQVELEPVIFPPQPFGQLCWELARYRKYRCVPLYPAPNSILIKCRPFHIYSQLSGCEHRAMDTLCSIGQYLCDPGQIIASWFLSTYKVIPFS